MSETKIYKHTNGYSAKLYGKSSMIICKGGKEVLHTGFRNVNTEDEVMERLEEMPKILELLGRCDFEEEGDNDI